MIARSAIGVDGLVQQMCVVLGASSRRQCWGDVAAIKKGRNSAMTACPEHVDGSRCRAGPPAGDSRR